MKFNLYSFYKIPYTYYEYVDFSFGDCKLQKAQFGITNNGNSKDFFISTKIRLSDFIILSEKKTKYTAYRVIRFIFW